MASQQRASQHRKGRPVTQSTLIDWDFPNPFVQSRVVADEDIDGLRHTNNAVYVNWCGEIAWEHTQSLGLGLAEYEALDRAMAVREARYEYLQATRLAQGLAIATWITRWDKRLTMERRFQIRDVASGDTVLRASMVFVCIEISTGKPRRPPPEFIEGYGPAVLDLPSD